MKTMRAVIRPQKKISRLFSARKESLIRRDLASLFTVINEAKMPKAKNTQRE